MFKVLLINPSRFQQSVIGSVFARHNVAVVMAQNGEEGLAALAGGHMDLLCFTLELGDMKGVDFYREALRRGLPRETPSLMVTTTADKLVFDEAMAAGITECFLKSDLAGLGQYVQLWVKRATRKYVGHVLLVEDSEAAAQFCIKVMSDMGLTVHHFRTAEAAIATLETQDYRVVVTDFVLEGLQTGLSVIRSVRGQAGRKGDTPILAMSALDSMARRIDILRAGATDFVPKPVVAEELAVRLGNMLMQQELFDRLDAQHEMVKELALRDQLTSLHNRHHLDAVLPRLLTEAERTQVPFSLAIFDVDFFKRVNDRYGHARGDQVLIAIATLLGQFCTGDRELVRYGGEEFVMLLPACTSVQAALAAEHIRHRIEQAKAGELPVTVSVGVATFQPGDDFDRIFARADAALYEAKRSGRNQVVCA